MINNLIRLQAALGAGSIRAVKALEYFGNEDNIFAVSEKERAAAGIFTQPELKRLKAFSEADAEKIISECKKINIKLIAFGSENYPYRLSVLENPPLILYVKGELPDFDNIPTVSIVGPRKVSEYGVKASYSLSKRLAAAGFTVVSGGAKGCDYYAHLGALKAGGKTALVMGCGSECGYLAENEPLRRHVAENGAVISEYPPHIKPSRFSFPIRNRIIAALSPVTVVIEAGKKSGALITANHAVTQGNEVFVIPGSPNDDKYAGSNALLRDGAKPLLDVSDIFGEYLPLYADKIDIKKAYSKEEKTYTKPSGKVKETPKIEEKTKICKKISTETLSNQAKIVYNCIDKHKFYPEEIKGTNLNGTDILSALTELEIEMLIRSLPGGCYEIID